MKNNKTVETGTKVTMNIVLYNDVNNKLPDPISYDETWEKLAIYCPNCGKNEVWRDTASGDYYVEELHLCSACDHGFYLPGGVRLELDNRRSKLRLAVLKAKKP
jgi:predicted RNA-binding Zn-ribbon protein involved in translation (DUF1610 family)